MFTDRIFPLMEADDGTNIAGAEEPEVAELAEEEVEGAEEQEVAEPADGDKKSADAAFAEMRRQNQELEKQLAEYEEALGYFFDGDDKALQAKAVAQERPLEDVKAEYERDEEMEALREENEALQERIANAEVERMMEMDLQAIQKIDPNVKSLTDLGDSFFNLIATGQVSGVEAYYAVKAHEQAQAAKTPDPVGRVSESSEKETFTREEVEAMSQAEVSKNYEAIRRSMSNW